MILVTLLVICSWCVLSLPLAMLIGSLFADHGRERPSGHRFELAA
ncbi:hypothetical protein [Nocardioides sp.]|nr:hypothetical protein [Nocardioides sp.]